MAISDWLGMWGSLTSDNMDSISADSEYEISILGARTTWSGQELAELAMLIEDLNIAIENNEVPKHYALTNWINDLILLKMGVSDRVEGTIQ